MARSTSDQTASEAEKSRHPHVRNFPDNRIDSDTSLHIGNEAAQDALANAHGEVNYKTMSWWQAGALMIAEIISMGILGLPKSMASLGLVPGMLMIIALGILSTYAGYNIGQFKRRYPWVLNMADAGYIMGGVWGRESMAFASFLLFIIIMALHLNLIGKAFYVWIDERVCSTVFTAVGLAISFLLTLPRTLKSVSFISIFSAISITASVFIVMISSGMNSKPKDIDLWGQDTLPRTMNSILSIVTAYSGSVAFFGFISELRKPTDYPKALFFLQSFTTTLYLIVAVVIYVYVGPGVTSPALDSAAPLLKKIGYGVAFGSIVISGVVNGHVLVKYFYVRFWRHQNEQVITSKSFKARFSWILICAILWTLAWILEEAIPVFETLLSLVSALSGSWFTYGIPGIFWLYMHKGKYTEYWRSLDVAKLLLLIVNVFLVVMAAVFSGLGMYGVVATAKGNSMSKPFQCGGA